MKRNLVNGWVILGAFGVAIILVVLSLIGFGRTAPDATEIGFKPAELTIIPGPTSTPRVTPTPTPDPAMVGTVTPEPGTIAVGGYVQIAGTDGDGLRLRATAGLDGEPLFLGYDAEVFQVRDGPQIADNYTWWYLVAPYDETRAGWAASDFLEAIPSP
ncbi:MAG: hypothetical protein GXP40_03475 [Chloroflexi bacterium]|nr:hypothetical protein [Chloroflexota bacterium]